MLIEKIADFVIETKSSTRTTAEYFTKNGIKISNATVSNLLNGKELKHCFPEKYETVQKILNEKNTSQVIHDEQALIRTKQAIELSLKGYTIPQIADLLETTEFVIYRDLTRRIKKLDNKELVSLIEKELEEHRIQNLKQSAKK